MKDTTQLYIYPASYVDWLFRYRNNQDYAEEIVIPKFELQPNK